MADVYKFKVKLQGLERIVWREIDISSLSSVAKLGYAILAAFECTGSHLFNIECNNMFYEIAFEENYFGKKARINPIKTKLTSLKLNVNDSLRMEYDYTAGWQFEIELLSITEMKRGTGAHYPYIVDGQGKGIMEENTPYELVKMIEITNKTGILPRARNIVTGNEIAWDYKDFDLEYCNLFLKDTILRIQDKYENYD